MSAKLVLEKKCLKFLFRIFVYKLKIVYVKLCQWKVLRLKCYRYLEMYYVKEGEVQYTNWKLIMGHMCFINTLFHIVIFIFHTHLYDIL